VDDVRLAIGAPLDLDGVVVGDVATDCLVLLLREVFAGPNQDAARSIALNRKIESEQRKTNPSSPSVLRARREVLPVTAEVQIQYLPAVPLERRE
jgi:hypothetical protein